MNPKPSNIFSYSSSPNDALNDPQNDSRIDAVLGRFTHAEPRAGLEARVAARLATAPRETHRSLRTLRLLVLQRVSLGALATAACCGIVVGTIRHSQRIALPQPVNSFSTGQTGAAGAIHTPTRVQPVSPKIDPESPRTPPRTRANITRNHGHRPVGAAVPRSPYPPEGEPETSTATPQQ